MVKYKVDLKRLRSLMNQALHTYRACLAAIDNGDRDAAVRQQLAAVEALDKFNDQLLRDLDRMGTQVKTTWVP